jgi:hypothetical protein
MAKSDDPDQRAARAFPDPSAMAAVLNDAIRALSRDDPGVGAGRREADAWRWVTASDPEWPFSFENVCVALALEPEELRSELLQRRAAQSSKREVMALVTGERPRLRLVAARPPTARG